MNNNKNLDDVGGLTDQRIYDFVAKHERTGKIFGPVEFSAERVLSFARAIEREALATKAAEVPSQAAAQVPSVGSIDTPEFRSLLWSFQKDPCSNFTIDSLIAHIDSHIARQRQDSKPTDLSVRLRQTADDQPGWKPLLTAAADEIDRYYGGMIAWKRTAEAKDAAQAAPADVRDAALEEQWGQAYAAFVGAFNTPQMRLRMPDEYSEDARKRMRQMDEAIRALRATSALADDGQKGGA